MNHQGTKAPSCLIRFAIILCVFVPSWFQLSAAETNYQQIDALFQKHCLDCHGAADAEGQLILDSYDLLMKGGETGPGVVPGKSADSILVKSVEGSFEKDGKRKIMPPGAKRKKLDSTEIALIKSWIDAGAKGPSGPRKPVELVTPKIPVKGEARRAINALAFLPEAQALTVARYGAVELWPQSRLDRTLRAVRVDDEDEEDEPTPLAPAMTLRDFRGSANAVVVSPKSELFIVGGEPGLSGEIQHRTAQGQVARIFSIPGDAFYSAALS